MRYLSPRSALALAALAALVACQPPDVGQRCEITWAGANPPTPTDPNFSSDYLETGNTACDNLVCIVSPVRSGKYSDCPNGACGYCSKPCVSNEDCYQSQTGLVCRQMVLDPAFIASLPPDVRQKYLGNASQFSSYCAVPLPPTRQ